MLQCQKDFLLEMTIKEKKWIIHDNVMLYRRTGGNRKELNTVDILESICSQLLMSKAYTEPRARLAICNIVLQRIQASTPLSPGLQAELNQRLFPSTPLSPGLQAEPNQCMFSSTPLSPRMQAELEKRLLPSTPLSPRMQAELEKRLLPSTPLSPRMQFDQKKRLFSDAPDERQEKESTHKDDKETTGTTSKYNGHQGSIHAQSEL